VRGKWAQTVKWRQSRLRDFRHLQYNPNPKIVGMIKKRYQMFKVRHFSWNSVFLFPDACELTLDPNTAHKNLRLSEGNRKVAWVEGLQPYAPHTDRFDACHQVLCEQGLEERCYFEVETVEPFSIGLTYKSIGRKGNRNDCRLVKSDKSWCMTCSEKGCYVWHGDEHVCISSLCSRSSRVGVYLDWKAGTLSFYKVLSNSLTKLHTFTAKFSEALYPAVELHPHSSASFCQLT